MLKKLAPFFIIITIIVIIVTLFISLASSQNMVVIKKGNTEQKPLTMKLGKYQDSDCGMVIEDLEYASQVIAPDGRTWFFHDHGGFIHWLSDKPFKDNVKIWVMSKDTHSWIDAIEAFYTSNEQTPMGYGFGAYKNFKKGMIPFLEMRLKMLRGETMNNPLIRKKLLEKKEEN